MSPTAARKKKAAPPRKLSIVEPTAPPVTSYKVAEVAAVEEAAQHLTQPMLECRDFGHTWTVASIVRVKGHFNRWLYCKRCKTNRRQVLSSDGEVLDTSYDYQEGYQFKGLGRMLADGRMALRRESLERAASSNKILDGTEEDDVYADKPVRKRA